MKVEEFIKFKLSRFKAKYAYEFGAHGIVLERIGGGICLYVTDEAHDDFHCVTLLGMDKDFSDTNFYVYIIDEDRIFFRVRRAVMYIDYANKFCATNVENFKVIGSEEWGQNCLAPWKDEYTKLYNQLENKRNGK